MDDTHNCFYATSYKNGRGGNITFNGTTVSRRDLNKKENNRKCEEALNLIISLYYYT